MKKSMFIILLLLLMGVSAQASEVEMIWHSPRAHKLNAFALNDQLQRAIKEGDLELVKEVVRAGANLDNSSEMGQTAVSMAVNYGQPHIVRYLIRYLIEYTKKAIESIRQMEFELSGLGETEFGDTGVPFPVGVQWYLERALSDYSFNAPENLTKEKKRARYRALRMLVRLTKNYLNTINLTKKGGALSPAIATRDTAVVELLLQHGALPNRRGDFTPLQDALRAGKRSIIDLLVLYGADTNQLSEDEQEQLSKIIGPREYNNDYMRMLAEADREYRGQERKVNFEKLSEALGIDLWALPYKSLEERNKIFSQFPFETLVVIALISPLYHKIVQDYTSTWVRFGGTEIDSVNKYLDSEVLPGCGIPLDRTLFVQAFKTLFPNVHFLEGQGVFLDYDSPEKLREVLGAFPSTVSLNAQRSGLRTQEEYRTLVEIFKNLRMLNISETVADSACLKILAQAQLQQLSAVHAQLKDSGLEAIGLLIGLEYLNLAKNYISAAGLAHLRGLSALRALNLSSNWLQTSEVGACLGKLTALEVLDISSSNINAEAIRQLISLVNLRSLNVAHSCLRGEELNAISETLPSLRRLNIASNRGDNIGLEALKKLGSLQLLESLNIAGNGLGFEGTLVLLETIKKYMPALKRLVLADNHMLNSRAELFEGKALDNNKLFAFTNRAKRIRIALAVLRALKTLEVSGNRIFDQENALALSQNLPNTKIIFEK